LTDTRQQVRLGAKEEKSEVLLIPRPPGWLAAFSEATCG